MEYSKRATWNLRVLTTKGPEINEEKENEYCCNNRNKEELKGTKYLEDYIMVYSGIDRNVRAQCGVALLVDFN